MLQLLLIVPLLGAVYLIAAYIEPIGFVLVNFSELFSSFFVYEQKVVLTCLLALPVAPHDVNKSGKGSLFPSLGGTLDLLGPGDLSMRQELKDILIGLLLGDLYVEKQKGYKNARLQFKQSSAHKEYLDYLYDLFKEYSGSKPPPL